MNRARRMVDAALRQERERNRMIIEDCRKDCRRTFPERSQLFIHSVPVGIEGNGIFGEGENVMGETNPGVDPSMSRIAIMPEESTDQCREGSTYQCREENNDARDEEAETYFSGDLIEDDEILFRNEEGRTVMGDDDEVVICDFDALVRSADNNVGVTDGYQDAGESGTWEMNPRIVSKPNDDLLQLNREYSSMEKMKPSHSSFPSNDDDSSDSDFEASTTSSSSGSETSNTDSDVDMDAPVQASPTIKRGKRQLEISQANGQVNPNNLKVSPEPESNFIDGDEPAGSLGNKSHTEVALSDLLLENLENTPAKPSSQLELPLDDPSSENQPSTQPSEFDTMPVEQKQGKKRKANPQQWMKNVSKFRRNHGLPYVSSSKNKIEKQGKVMREPCSQKCKLKCAEKFSYEQRKKIFDKYWALTDLEAQRSFLFNNMTKVTTKHDTRHRPRRDNHAFHFTVEQQKIRVCKIFFKNTLSINDRPIRTVISKSEGDGFLQPDCRGKHGHHKQVDITVKESVRRFIGTIPRVESHYLRAQTTREYIEGGRSLADIYRDYQQQCMENNEVPASETMFSRIFNYEFNISFFVPKKDQCDLCNAFQNAEGDDKAALKQQFDDHLFETKLSRDEKETDKRRMHNDPNLKVATYDLQAVLPAPKGEASVFYYKSKVNSYNFTICDITLDNVDCFFWHEGEGNRGANEIGSCVFHYLKDLASEHNNDNLEVIFYSDNCGGQQKNKFVMAMYLYAVETLNLKSVTHKFLVRGHTQNEGDNCHSVIEKEVKKAIRKGPIYTPYEYVRIIKSAKKKGRPYNVHELTHESFYDLKKLANSLGTNFTKTSDDNIIKFNDVKIFMAKKSDPGVLFVKTSYEQENFSRITVKSRQRKSKLTTVTLAPAYQTKQALPERKKKDLKDLLTGNHIPKFYEVYYDSILK